MQVPASESKHVKTLQVNLSGRDVYLEQDDASENTTGSTLWLSGQIVRHTAWQRDAWFGEC